MKKGSFVDATKESILEAQELMLKRMYWSLFGRMRLCGNKLIYERLTSPTELIIMELENVD